MSSTREKRRPTTAGLASARARFEKRASAARRRPRRVAALAVAALLLVGLLAWLGWYSPLFTVETVHVEGTSTAQAKQVRAVGAVPLGGPVLRVDTDAVSSRIEADRRWADVEVQRSLPHAVTIIVRPRTAALAIALPGGKIEVVDATGFAFLSPATPPPDLPLVTAGAAAVSPAGVTAALQALGALAPDLRARVSKVAVSAADQVTFSLKVKGKRRTVVWGGPGDAATKAKLVSLLLDQPGSTVDVSVPGSPVTR